MSIWCPARGEDRENVANRHDALARDLASVVKATRLRNYPADPADRRRDAAVVQNLTHDYDRLQATYARLLESASDVYPGVAVLEIEEARAIGRELAVAGGELRDRVVPVFVEGEFEMSRKPGREEPTVRLAVRITDGKRALDTLERPDLAMPAVPDFLLGEVAGAVAKRASVRAATPLSQEAGRWLAGPNRLPSWEPGALRHAPRGRVAVRSAKC